MDRRETIKSILLGSMGSSVLLESCVSSLDNKVLDKIWEYQYGRTSEEKKRDDKFTIIELFNTVSDELWSELNGIEEINSFRRETQSFYIDLLAIIYFDKNYIL